MINATTFYESFYLPGGECVSRGVPDVHDVEGSGVALAGHDGAHSPQVPPARDHAQVACKHNTF